MGAAGLDAAQILRTRQTITNDAGETETPVGDEILHLNRNIAGTQRITFEALAGANGLSFRRTNGSRATCASLNAGETIGSLQRAFGLTISPRKNSRLRIPITSATDYEVSSTGVERPSGRL